MDPQSLRPNYRSLALPQKFDAADKALLLSVFAAPNRYLASRIHSPSLQRMLSLAPVHTEDTLISTIFNTIAYRLVTHDSAFLHREAAYFRDHKSFEAEMAKLVVGAAADPDRGRPAFPDAKSISRYVMSSGIYGNPTGRGPNDLGPIWNDLLEQQSNNWPFFKSSPPRFAEVVKMLSYKTGTGKRFKQVGPLIGALIAGEYHF